jgi:hypothetical protein
VTDDPEPEALLGLTVYLLSRVARLGKRELDARLAERGLAMRQVAVLAAVAESGPTGQLPIGRHVRLDPSDVTATVDALEAAGLVTRSVDPTDRPSTARPRSPTGSPTTCWPRSTRTAAGSCTATCALCWTPGGRGDQAVLVKRGSRPAAPA